MEVIYIKLEVVILTSIPPCFDLPSLISPPCDLIMSLVIAKPRPLSPFSLFREGSSVKNGLNTSS
jgi:hypothetical protein